MRRRHYLALVGAVPTFVLAGCAEGDTEYENGNGDGNGDDENGEGGLELVEHDLVVEGDIIDDVSIEGIVENSGDERVDYAEVSVRVFDADGNQLDRYFTNTNDLDAGQTWAFEVSVFEDAEDVSDYDIGISDSPF